MPPIHPYSPAPAHQPPATGARPPRRSGVVLLLVVVALAGCGAPPELREPPSRPATPTATPAATGSPTLPPVAPVSPLPLPPSPVLDEAYAGACPEGPAGDRIVSLVRGSAGVIPSGVRVRVKAGPFCAGRWHYTVLDVTGHEELQVVTRSDTGRLRLVTAGTDVCTIEVRTAATTGIRAIACDRAPLPAATGGLPGAGPPGVGVPGM